MLEAPSPRGSRHWSPRGCFFLALILLLGFALRIACVSCPYFVDGPSHVYAVETRWLFLQAPGYFLFNWCALLVVRITHIPAAQAIQVLNLFFGEAGLVLFALLSRHRLSEPDALLVTLCFAVSPMLWFAADIHSTYVAMSCSAPLLFLCFEDWKSMELGILFWALMTGFRPSDGVFVLPWVFWQTFRYPWPARLRGLLIALVTVSLWWIPTARHFGSPLSPIASSGRQVGSLAHGLLTGQLSVHTLLDQLRVASGILLGWALLLPFAFWAIFVGSWRSRSLFSILLWTAPGLGFFCLYYIADPIYVVYFVGPGLLAAALWLSTKGIRFRASLYVASATFCLVYMFTAHPISKTGKAAVIANAYFFKFSRWSLEHRYAPRLAALAGACGQSDVQGPCMERHPAGR